MCALFVHRLLIHVFWMIGHGRYQHCARVITNIVHNLTPGRAAGRPTRVGSRPTPWVARNDVDYTLSPYYVNVRYKRPASWPNPQKASLRFVVSSICSFVCMKKDLWKMPYVATHHITITWFVSPPNHICGGVKDPPTMPQIYHQTKCSVPICTRTTVTLRFWHLIHQSPCLHLDPTPLPKLCHT